MLFGLLGLVVLFIALISTSTGTTYGRGGRTDRATEPFTYWLTLGLQYLLGAYLIWYWFYKADH
jgi:hypothetical protein